MPPSLALARPQASTSEVDTDSSHVEHVPAAVDLLHDERCIADIRQLQFTFAQGWAGQGRMPEE